MKRIGLVTIGQTPRVDLVPEIKAVLDREVEITEKGALDGLSPEEVDELKPVKGDDTLVTRMADGTEVKLGERKIIPRVQAQIKALEEEGLATILLACTGEFPAFTCSSLLVRPQRVLYHVVASLAAELTLGVLVPDELQVAAGIKRWSKAAARVVVTAASPYIADGRIEASVREFSREKADLLVMDCMGYTLEMKKIVAKNTHKPVILARSVTARILNELL